MCAAMLRSGSTKAAAYETWKNVYASLRSDLLVLVLVVAAGWASASYAASGDPGRGGALAVIGNVALAALGPVLLTKVHQRLIALEFRRGGVKVSPGLEKGVGGALQWRMIAVAAQPLDDGRADGARSADGQVMGTYLHGLFESADASAAILRWAGLSVVQAVDYHALRERDIERLADQVEQHLDIGRLRSLCGLSL